MEQEQYVPGVRTTYRENTIHVSIVKQKETRIIQAGAKCIEKEGININIRIKLIFNNESVKFILQKTGLYCNTIKALSKGQGG